MVEEAARARSGIEPVSSPRAGARPTERPAGLIELEERLAERLDATVKIDYNGKTGKVVLRFRGLEELERIYRTMFGEHEG